MTSKYEDLTPAITFASAALVLILGAVGAYVLSSHSKRGAVRTGASWIAAVVSALVAFIATAGFAIPILGDFRIPGEPFREAFFGAIVVWAIALCPWVIAIRCAIAALRGAREVQIGNRI